MTAVSTPPQKIPWQTRRKPVSVLAEMAFRRETVSIKLKELRERHGLSQEDAAHKVGVNLRQWQRWEAGDSMPYPRNLDTIASRFGISVAEFFGSTETQLDRIEALLVELVDHQRAEAKKRLAESQRSAAQRTRKSPAKPAERKQPPGGQAEAS